MRWSVCAGMRVSMKEMEVTLQGDRCDQTPAPLQTTLQHEMNMMRRD